MMFPLKVLRFILLVCVLAFPVSPVQASKSNSYRSIDDLQSSVFLSSLVSAAILVMPVVFSKEAVDDSIKASSKGSAESKAQRCEKPCCGQPLPEMVVQQIGYDDKGQRQVIFAMADNPQHHLTLLWLLPHYDKNLPDPAAGFVVGQAVSFQPSTQFSGCLLHDESGAALAFVPAANAVPGHYSEIF